MEQPNGYARLYEIVAANPSFVTEKVTTTLMDAMETCRWSGFENYGDTLLQVAAAFLPEKVLSLRKRLMNLGGRGLGDPADDAASNYQMALSVLARAEYARSRSNGKVSLATIEQQLRNGPDAEQRTYGSYAAYLFWLDRPEERASIEKRLRELVAEPQAELRIAASRALEMIWVGQLTLAKDFGVPPGVALARIDMFAKFPEEHVASAARIVMEKWVDSRSSAGGD